MPPGQWDWVGGARSVASQSELLKKSIKIMDVRNKNQGLVQKLTFENLSELFSSVLFFVVRCNKCMKTVKNPNSWNSV